MVETVVHATPRSVAIAGVTPLILALLAAGDVTAFAVALGAGIAMFFGWSWVVGHALNARIQPRHRPPLGAFRAAVLFCSAYAATFLLAFANTGSLSIGHFPFLYFALHALAILSAVSVVRFIAHNLELAEAAAGIPPPAYGRTVASLFSIAGVLPTQRRIKRLFDGRSQFPPPRGGRV